MRADKKQAVSIFKTLGKRYPNANCELDFTNPFELIVATVLSAQCTDKRVNLVTPALFKRYPTPKKMASAKILDLEKYAREIRSGRR